ncbi:N-acylneuraminate cytidylyltransferase A [Zootermopsis nevadensis]|uniref:N-acylneuraminate cytidylyltransferase A n=1 Tax=Zootermopsis nevadensis TaxID=136037 RepID=UPI000B8EA42E|nr:N-acylneuraminate cytidylyltransferase A [Zootermopsis nevadensis]
MLIILCMFLTYFVANFSHASNKLFDSGCNSSLREIRSVLYNGSYGCSHFDTSKEPHFASLILARGGSKGIPLKNLAKVNGTTLLKRSLNTIHEFGRFSSVWVSTDSADIAKEASTAGAQVHWRSPESATDSAPSIVGVQEFCSFHPEVDIVALIQCTSPFLKTSFLAEAYRNMQTGRFDSVFSVTQQYKLRWKRLPDGGIEPLNFNPKRRPRRQDWDGELVENGMFYFATKNLINYGLLQGGSKSCIRFEASVATECSEAPSGNQPCGNAG